MACLLVKIKDDPRPHSQSVAVLLGDSSPCSTSVGVRSRSAHLVGQPCPRLWLPGSLHRGRRLPDSADNNPCSMSVGVHCRSAQPADQPVDLACPQLLRLGSRRRDLLPGLTAPPLAASSPRLMNADVHSSNECPVDLACPQLLRLGSRHKDLLTGSTAVFLAPSNPWLMNVGIYSHNGRLVDQPCPLPASRHRDLLLGSIAVFLADSSPRLMNVGVHCHNAQPAGQPAGQPCPQTFPQLLPPDSLHGDLLPHEEHHFLPSDPLNLRSRELLPLVPGTPAILPPCKMS